MDDNIKLQPLVGLKTMAVIGFEVLYKKMDDTDYPSASYILQSVFSKYHGRNDLQLFINMSAADVISSNFSRLFLKKLDELKIDGTNVVLELNERTHPDLLSQAKKSLSLLRTYGVKIALDDFGTEYSNLSFMSELPIDIIKIDKKFVKLAPTSKKARSLIRFCVEMSHDIGCTVVAEGIETEEHLKCTVALDADIGQGFLFSTPFQTKKEHVTPFINIGEFVEVASIWNHQADCRLAKPY